MILSGREITKRVGGDIIITPFRPERVNANSYNLTLAKELLVYDDTVLDMKRENKTRTLEIPEEGLVLTPGMLYLGRTEEYTETRNLVPLLEGRSSIGRLGLSIHITAGFGDVGFCGYWTLEINCIHPIKVYAGVQVCQVFYHTIEGEHDNYMSGKYQNNKGVQPSLLFKDFEER